MKYKLLVLDVDGTLVDQKGNINRCDTEAVKKAVGAGVTVALSTGRVVQACDRVLKELCLDGYHIFFDGALVSNPHTGDVIYSKPINKEKVLQTVEYSRETSTYLELYAKSSFYAEKSNWTDEIHDLFFNVSIMIDDLAVIGKTKEILKMETIARHPEEYEQAKELIKEFEGLLRFSTASSPAFPGVNFYNILHPEVSKGNALEVLCDYLGITLEETIAIGDGLNDLSLIKTAGLGVAMGNAYPEVKAVADVVTDSVDEGGISKVVSDYILNGI